MQTSATQSWFAARLQMEWPPERQRQADDAGILLFRAWPAAVTYWRNEWGSGNAFIGYPDDPAEVCVELPAGSEHDAVAKIVKAFRVDIEAFVVKPSWIARPHPSS
jgi:hypothetical protein